MNLNPVVVIAGIFFLTLPLLGWGYDDTAQYFANPIRLILFVTWAAVLVISIFTSPTNTMSKGDTTKIVSRQSFALKGIAVFSAMLYFVAPYSDRREIVVIQDVAMFRVVGLLLFMLGGYYAVYSCIYLGKNFSVYATIQSGHRLITTGPYKRIRHPRYLGVILLNFGYALAFRSMLAMCIAIIVITFLLWRISDEEKMLASFFGKEYEQYCEGTGRIFPKKL